MTYVWQSIVAILLFSVLAAGSARAEKPRLDAQEALLEHLSPTPEWQRAAQLKADQMIVLLNQSEAGMALGVLDAIDDPLIHDQAAALVLQALPEQAASPARRAYLDGVQQRPQKVWQRHEETRADWFVPVFHIHAQARALPAQWQANEWRKRWLGRYASVSAQWVDQLVQRQGEATEEYQREMRVAAEVLASLPPQLFERVYERLIDVRSLPASIALALSGRAPAESLLRQVIDHGQSSEILGAIDVLRHWADPAAERLLVELEAQSEWSSAATLALVPKWVDKPAPIVSRLADPKHRASTASAIARLPETEMLAVIERLANADKQIDQGLMLALELQGGEVAMRRAEAMLRALDQRKQP
ncbi:hypothetical protein [Pseudomarimonas arenosa]|uniref:HEAT repeat domain-containing protein n=1 Tax=Pseudomarimonas arenosa TaxID=2774145 RepID=A0AAW3ZQR3_9GAMM|nr:hypothetical protein [Pseudomarimonas arenosa]MBD8526927.1 hypothetical protein [Pseudomarimonas arenosa]